MTSQRPGITIHSIRHSDSLDFRDLYREKIYGGFQINSKVCGSAYRYCMNHRESEWVAVTDVCASLNNDRSVLEAGKWGVSTREASKVIEIRRVLTPRLALLVV